MGRAAHWLAIVVGGAGGTLAALLGSSTPPAPPRPAASANLPLRPVDALTRAASASGPASAIASSLPGPAESAQASEPARATESAAAGTSASPALSASGTPPPTAALPAAELLPLPTTKQGLLRAEMHCDQHKAEDCIVAARSYETGSAGQTDREKAAKYRRIALTAWLSQCDHHSVLACATLATMYRTGSGVPQSDRNADALIARARELCRYHPTPACQELPSQ